MSTVARLPRVALVITEAAGGASVRLSTGSLGTFRSPDLAPGSYEMRATLSGFEEKVVPVVVRAGGEIPLDLSLDVASVQETVSVVGEAPRGTLEAAELREGAALDIGEALGWKAGLWRLRKGGIANEVVLRGLQSRDVNVLIDGQRVYGACPNHMDPAAFHVDVAEVDRVEVGRGPFDVKNQGALGGTINVVTRKPGIIWDARKIVIRAVLPLKGKRETHRPQMPRWRMKTLPSSSDDQAVDEIPSEFFLEPDLGVGSECQNVRKERSRITRHFGHGL